jgi:hypothetical protein
MSVYDYFRGPCPACNENDDKDGFTIQSTWFSVPIPGQCFRDFRPGYHLPGVLPFVYTPIGTSTCCHAEINAVCYGTLLCAYRVHVVDEPTENNIELLRETNLVPEYDNKRYNEVSFRMCKGCKKKFVKKNSYDRSCRICHEVKLATGSYVKVKI